MASEQTDMTLRDYGSVVWLRKWLVVTPVVLAALMALVFSALQTPVYSADSRVLIEQRGEDRLFDTGGGGLDVRSIQTEIQVLEGEAVRARVQVNLALDELPPPAEATTLDGTNVIEVSARDTSAENAAALADTYAGAYIEVRREQSIAHLSAASVEVQAAIEGLQRQIGDLSSDDARREVLLAQQANFETTLDQLRVDAALQTGGATIIRTAAVPTTPVEPTPGRSAALAAVVGLLIGLAAAFIVEYLDDKVRSAHDLEDAAGLPVLAEVPVDRPPDNRPIAIAEPTHAAVEEYRGLRTNLLFIGLDRPVKVIQVTSSLSGEGKTTTASNLAVVLARAGHKVALVDADLRRPRIHEVFSVDMSPGLTDVLLGAQPSVVVKHVQLDDDATISVYTSGVVPANPGEMLSSRRIGQLMDGMREQYDYVVVDSPPVVPVSDSVALTAAVDTVLLVAHSGRVTKKDVGEAINRLAQVSAPVVGSILNQSADRQRVNYGYGGNEQPWDAPSLADGAPSDLNA